MCHFRFRDMDCIVLGAVALSQLLAVLTLLPCSAPEMN